MKAHLVAVLVLSVLISNRGFGLNPGWSSQPSPTFSHLYGVAFSDANTWIAVGQGGTIVRSTDAGVTWAAVTSPIGDDLRAVSFRGNIGVATGLAGAVLRSTDGGLTWLKEARPTTKILFAVSLGDSFAVITGEEGTILASTDAGVTWALRSAGTASIFFGVSVRGPTSVAVGGAGAVAMSTNNAQAWGLTFPAGGGLVFFYGTSFITPTTGWAVGAITTGSIIIKSTDRGFVWTGQTSPTTNTLTGVSFTSLDTGTAVGFNGTIIRTTNGGTVWTNQQSPTLRSLHAVSFLDNRTGVAVGDSGTILLTTDGGLTALGPDGRSQTPLRMELEQNYPNPFNPTTVISFHLPASGQAGLPVVSMVRLVVYDLLGHEVSVLVNERRDAGIHNVRFDASGLSSGVYLYRLQAGEFTQTKRLILVR